MREIPVSFRSGPNLLHGTLALPEQAPCGAVVLVHGWSGCRMGPHRILVETARHVAGLGLAALRFDLSGRGESEGDPFATDIDRMIEDTRCAVRELRRRLDGGTPIALWGMCSGGNVCLGALGGELDVRAVVCWSTYPFQSQRGLSQDVKRTRHFLGHYLRGALRGETWRRLLRGRINLRGVLGVLFGHLRRPPAAGTRNPQQSVRDREIVEELAAFPGRLLFVFGGADPEAADAREIFRNCFSAGGSHADFEEIEGANHNFYSLQWKRAVIEGSARWLVGALQEGGRP